MQGFVLNLGQARCLAGSGVAGRRYREDRLAYVLNQLAGQYWIAGKHWANIGMPGYIRQGNHCHHAGIGTNRAQVHAKNARVGLLTVADGGVQQAFWL